MTLRHRDGNTFRVAVGVDTSTSLSVKVGVGVFPLTRGSRLELAGWSGA